MHHRSGTLSAGIAEACSPPSKRAASDSTRPQVAACKGKRGKHQAYPDFLWPSNSSQTSAPSAQRNAFCTSSDRMQHIHEIRWAMDTFPTPWSKSRLVHSSATAKRTLGHQPQPTAQQGGRRTNACEAHQQHQRSKGSQTQECRHLKMLNLARGRVAGGSPTTGTKYPQPEQVPAAR